MSFRDSIRAISPPWFQDAVAGGIQFAEGLALDAIDTWTREGVKARFPGVSSNDAMGYISNDRKLLRGPPESNASFAGRLRAAFDTWIGAGNPYTIIPLLQACFSSSAPPSIRLVSNSSVWFESALGGAIVKTVGAANWIWETFTPTRWWRGWAIIDQSGFGSQVIWGQDLWGAATGTWGDGYMWGAVDSGKTSGGITPDQSAYLIRTLRRFKPANVAAMILVTFSPEVFDVDGAAGAPVNPNGNMSDPTTRLTFNAIYSSEIV